MMWKRRSCPLIDNGHYSQMSDAGVQGANGGERRRRTWSADQKQRIIAESFAPGASVAEVARRYGLNSNMLFTWLRRERADINDVGKTVNIVPVRVVEAMPTATATAPASMGRMEIVLVGGERIIVGTDVDATALGRIVKALGRR
jgi:transposase